MKTIEPHFLFTIYEPDTVAECIAGVTEVDGLYARLWDLVEIAYEDYVKPETPDTHYGHVFGNDLAQPRVWKLLSDEDKLILNELAIAHEKED